MRMRRNNWSLGYDTLGYATCTTREENMLAWDFLAGG
jgi:hypothetical protein